jgi:hypothetical protein
MYQITSSRRKTRQRRSRFWLFFFLFFLAVGLIALVVFILSLHQKPVITQSKAVTTKVSYVGKTKIYNEGDFNIAIPVSWQLLPRPPYTYQSFTWHDSTKGSSQEIEVYEDTIPTNFAVNRALIIKGETDHVELDGIASDNCVTFTKDIGGGQGGAGVRGKWRGVDFLCNRTTTTRDVIGTSSASGGVNTVALKTTNGTPHSFFFTYTDTQLSPDYAVFYNALTSFGMN